MTSYDDPSGLTRYDSPTVFYDSVAAPSAERKKRMKITLNLSKKTVLEIIDLGKLTKTKLTGNVKFPNTNPPLVDYGTLITEAETAKDDYEAAKTTADEKLVIRNMKMDALRAGITLQASYVEDHSSTAADVDSAGFTPRPASAPTAPPGQVLNVSVTRSDNDGALDLHWDPDAAAKMGYEIHTSPDPFTSSSWTSKDIVSQSNVTLAGLTSGTRLWVRVRALGSNSQKGAWSEPVSKIVP